MSEKRGRKRRARDRRERAAPAAVARAAAPAAQPSRAVVPSNTARATGFAIAVITVFLAILTAADGVTGDHAAGEAAVRVAVGVLLVGVGIVVAALSLFPAQIRRMVRGDSG
jgi:hypothetical protein